jgi:NAD(P)-dependent dehydrogenase (short-subunit alcohol dehydrogenase family)
MTQSPAARHVLVTGAGRGIGRAIAERLARGGFDVVGTVRDAARARALTEEARAGGRRLRYEPLELGRGADVASFAGAIRSGGGPDIVVHNAGFGVFGAVEEVGADLVAEQFAVNLFGPLELTRQLLPALRERRGQVIWIGSLAGRISLPFQAHYSATKAAVAAISDAMRMELAPHGVRVSCVEPGDFATGFTAARVVQRRPESPYLAAQTRCLSAVERQERGAPPPERVAAAVERLCRAEPPAARRPVGQGARATCLLLRLLPDRLRELIVAKHYEL